MLNWAIPEHVPDGGQHSGAQDGQDDDDEVKVEDKDADGEYGEQDEVQDSVAGSTRPARTRKPNMKYSGEEFDLSMTRIKSRRSIRRALWESPPSCIFWRCVRLTRH